MKKLTLLVLSPLLLAGCASTDYFTVDPDSGKPEEVSQTKVTETETATLGGGLTIANPASVYCVDKGGKLDIRNVDAKGEIGYCVFDDGSECEEWAYFRKECPAAAKAK